MAKTLVHVCLDIQGYLQNHTKKSEYAKLFRKDNGTLMSADEAKRYLLDQLALGRKVLPFGECDGFDFETGCPGHPVAEE